MLEFTDGDAASWIMPDHQPAELCFDVASDAVTSSEKVRITLSTTLELAVADRCMETHQIVVARLRADLQAAISLRNALNKAIVLAERSGRLPPALCGPSGDAGRD